MAQLRGYTSKFPPIAVGVAQSVICVHKGNALRGDWVFGQAYSIRFLQYKTFISTSPLALLDLLMGEGGVCPETSSGFAECLAQRSLDSRNLPKAIGLGIKPDLGLNSLD